MTEKNAVVTAALIIIGNEILSGGVRDENMPFFAKRLNEEGIQLKHCRVVPDDGNDIGRAVNECRAAYDYVFTTGGIGPTHDDITADSVAAAFGVPIDFHPEAVAILQDHYARTGNELNAARMRMARIPEGGTLVENPISRAPGFRLDNVYVLAGVPTIARAMFESLKHELTGGLPVRSKAIAAFLSEGQMAAGLGAIQDRYPDVDIGSYPFYRDGRFGTSIVSRSQNVDALEAVADAVRALMQEKGGMPIEDMNDPG